MTQDLWYALMVKSRFERIVAANLRNRGYDPFLPTHVAKRQWSDRVRSLELPLFPGYLFCQIDLRSRLPILTTPGVNLIVGIGRAPKPIDEQEIESLRRIVSSGLHYEPYPHLAVGQLVRVEHGALEGLVGLVTDLKRASRLIISINLLMRSVSTDIDRSWVKPIDVTHKQYFQLRPVLTKAAVVGKTHTPAKLKLS